jgi:hypothetical protein
VCVLVHHLYCWALVLCATIGSASTCRLIMGTLHADEVRVIYDVGMFEMLVSLSSDTDLYLCLHETDKGTDMMVDVQRTRLHMAVSQHYSLLTDAMPSDVTLPPDRTLVGAHFFAVMPHYLLEGMAPVRNGTCAAHQD